MLIKDFFYKSIFLDKFTLRPLSHIRHNWDLDWNDNSKGYIEEDNSFAKEINDLIMELEMVNPPKKYHEHEDKLAEYVSKNLNWGIEKIGAIWNKAQYESILEQGGFGDINENNLILAASGRIHKAIEFGQKHFDEMEMRHMKILATILTIILYHRAR